MLNQVINVYKTRDADIFIFLGMKNLGLLEVELKWVVLRMYGELW